MADSIGPILGSETVKVSQTGALVDANAAQFMGVLTKSGAVTDWAATAGLGPLTTRIGLFGDSRPASAHHSAPPANIPVATITGLTIDDKSSRGVAAFVESITGGRVQFRRSENWSAAGDSTTDMVNRLTTAVAAIKAGNVGTVIILASTNDRTSGISLATTKANCTIIENAFLDAGIRVVWISETPRGDAANAATRLTGTILQDHMSMRHWFNGRHNGRNVFTVDVWSALADPISTTGDIAAGNSTDSLHPDAPGNYKMALRIAPVITLLYPPRDPLPGSATDVWSASNTSGFVTNNPILDGTAGTLGTGSTGQLASSWSSSNAPAGTAVAAAFSKVTGTDGYPEQQIVLSGTTTAASFWTLANCNLTLAGNPAGITTGTILEALGSLEIAPGATGIRGIYLRIVAGSITNRSNGPGGPSVTVFAPLEYYNGVTRVPPISVPADATAVAVNLQVYTIAGVALSATIKLKRCGIRIVA